MRMVAAISSGLAVQVDWLGLRVGGQQALIVCIHQMNRMNSRNGFAMMTAPLISSRLLLLLLLLLLFLWKGGFCFSSADGLPWTFSSHEWCVMMQCRVPASQWVLLLVEYQRRCRLPLWSSVDWWRHRGSPPSWWRQQLFRLVTRRMLMVRCV